MKYKVDSPQPDDKVPQTTSINVYFVIAICTWIGHYLNPGKALEKTVKQPWKTLDFLISEDVRTLVVALNGGYSQARPQGGGVRWVRTHSPPPPPPTGRKGPPGKIQNAKDESFLLICQRTQLFTVYKTYTRLLIT